jgi:hypothetical protein
MTPTGLGAGEQHKCGSRGEVGGRGQQTCGIWGIAALLDFDLLGDLDGVIQLRKIRESRVNSSDSPQAESAPVSIGQVGVPELAALWRGYLVPELLVPRIMIKAHFIARRRSTEIRS